VDYLYLVFKAELAEMAKQLTAFFILVKLIIGLIFILLIKVIWKKNLRNTISIS